MAASETTTQDDFLGGKVRVLQPRKGYRAGVDAVMLAAAVPAKAGQTVLELGCGVGVASLCLHARVSGLTITAIEVQDSYAALARSNAAANRANMEVVTTDLREMPPALRQMQFDHVIANPPYFDRNHGTASGDEGRDIAMGGETDLADWFDVAIRRLAPKGYLTVIQHMTRLPEMLIAVGNRLGSVTVLPIAGRAGKTPELVLLQARHSGRAPFCMLAPLVMHDGLSHEGDRESYTETVRKILRDGAFLDLSC